MKPRIMLLVIILGFGAVALGWIYESRLRPQSEQRKLVVPNNIDYFLTDLNVRAMNAEGELDYEFASRRLEHYPHTDSSQIEAPALQIFRQDQRWLVDSRQGEFQHRQNLLRLTRDVVLRKLGAQPFTLYSEQIRFEPDHDLVASESPVVMLSKDSRIEAERAVFDLKHKVYRFRNAQALYDDAQS